MYHTYKNFLKFMLFIAYRIAIIWFYSKKYFLMKSFNLDTNKLLYSWYKELQ